MSDFQYLQDTIGEWADEHFGSSRGPKGLVEHLKEEVEHLSENPYNPMNFADVFILLINASREAGFSMHDIYRAVEAKHKINVSRIWGEPDEHGITRHIKGNKL